MKSYSGFNEDADGIVRQMEVSKAGPDHPEYAYYREASDHIQEVQERLQTAIDNLHARRMVHDRSKLSSLERQGFMAMNDKHARESIAYDSPEYKAMMAAQKGTIDHHYDLNDHHPEYWRTHFPNFAMYPGGESGNCEESGWAVSCMDLMALIEMLCDWSAASLRYKDSSFATSWCRNKARFGIDSQLGAILLNTAVSLGLMTMEEAQSVPDCD